MQSNTAHPQPHNHHNDSTALDDDDDDDEEEEEKEEEMKEDRPVPPPSRKVDIFSSIGKSSAKRPIKAIPSAPRPAPSSSLSRFDDLDDDGDLPALPLPPAKRAKPSLRPTPSPLPPSLDPDNFSDSDADPTPPDTDADALSYYNRLVHQQQAKRGEKKGPVPTGGIPNMRRDVVEGKRYIGRLIEKNEGMKASRPKDRKTPQDEEPCEVREGDD